MKLKHLFLAAATGMGATAASAGASEVQEANQKSIPRGILDLVGENKELLAYKSVKDGEGGSVNAIVVRTPKAPAPNRGIFPVDNEGYSCELILIQEMAGKLTVTGRTRAAVECKVNQINLVAGRLELDDQLSLSPDHVTFINEKIYGGSDSYSFSMNDGKWHLSRAASLYKETGVKGVLFARGVASYPKDLGLISMEKFDPDKIRDALEKNKATD